MFSSETFWIITAIGMVFCWFMRYYYPLPPPSAVGIDLGTAFSSVAVFNNGFSNVSVLKDEINGNLIPSTVTFFKNGSIVVGKFIHDDLEPFVTFYDSKRFIGRYNLTEADIPHYPFDFKLIDGAPYYQLPPGFINRPFVGRLLKPYQISSLVLSHIKMAFKKNFGVQIKKAVLGVPVEFDDFQRRETVYAANLAGIEVTRLVNEPTAASMACDVHLRPEIENVVVLDLGGGTYDVAVLISLGNSLATRSIAGNDRLGGRDFTHRFANCILEFVKIVPDFIGSEFREFMESVEQLKIKLSINYSSKILFSKGSKFIELEVSRDDFEECTAELFKQLLIPISLALEEIELLPCQVHEIILVGGATKMPKFRKIITEYFGRQPNTSVDPDSAVVIGLSNQAGIIMQGWPLDKSAIDIPPGKIKKIYV